MSLQIRNRLVESIREELLGPSNVMGAENLEEVITESPTQRYLVGQLYPSGTPLDEGETEQIADQGAEAASGERDSSSSLAALNPSSIGLSFNLTNTNEISVEISFGFYTELDSVPDEEHRKLERRFQRTPFVRTFDLVLEGGPIDIEVIENSSIFLRGRTIRTESGFAVTLFLLNGKHSPGQGDLFAESIFQPKIRVMPRGDDAQFSSISLQNVEDSDPELESLALLYSSVKEFSVGHGCATIDGEFSRSRNGPVSVETELIPTFEVPSVNARDVGNFNLDMRQLGELEGQPGKIRNSLQPLVDEYRGWIQDLEGYTEALAVDSPAMRRRANENIESCSISADRIQEGIDLICGDSNESLLVRKAFCFSMRAMAMQRVQSEIAAARKANRSMPQPEEIQTKWRPFQIAFILLSIPSLTDRTHSDRDIAELLWFPTGGGKTEAYLGLTAFILAFRRLRPSINGYRNDLGIAVLMRYTLRLLTIQQFQRAATLICATEILRSNEAVWGQEPFTLGLWVGQGSTPNVYDDEENGAKQALSSIQSGEQPKKGSPVQLTNCPWCGFKLDVNASYVADDDEQRIKVFCPSEICPFSFRRYDGIPVHVVDEEIYRFLPSLVIATVDKFARLPWNGRTANLFGRVEERCARHGFIARSEKHPRSHRETSTARAALTEASWLVEPVDLIIQDELHLITGPLGTLVGMYESVIDYLSSMKVSDRSIGPKVVASTATIRRAEGQVSAIFDRRLQIFPSSGIDARDSWFAQQAENGRIFLGIYAPGKSVKTALIRVYANLLSRSRELATSEMESSDPYLTLVGYFNSLRELGGSLRLLEDDVPSRIKVLNRRDKEKYFPRTRIEKEELTSNRTAQQVPEILARLEVPFTQERKSEYPLDFLLASNMISVGVDVNRLGLMVVNGQPKTTAEYIQATSRVGRRYPGLIVTVYNWTRPRDVSHYESFRTYHASMYRYVEPTSATPFSSRARDKALAGVIASLSRLLTAEMVDEVQAKDIAKYPELIAEITSVLMARMSRILGEEQSTQVRNEIQALFDRWTQAAFLAEKFTYSKFGYGAKSDPSSRFLLSEQEGDDSRGIFRVPGSLREVEREIPIKLKGSVDE